MHRYLVPRLGVLPHSPPSAPSEGHTVRDGPFEEAVGDAVGLEACHVAEVEADAYLVGVMRGGIAMG